MKHNTEMKKRCALLLCALLLSGGMLLSCGTEEIPDEPLPEPSFSVTAWMANGYDKYGINAPIPENRPQTYSLDIAGNEKESFQLCLRGGEILDPAVTECAVTAELSGLSDGLSAEIFRVCSVKTTEGYDLKKTKGGVDNKITCAGCGKRRYGSTYEATPKRRTKTKRTTEK